MPKDKVYKFGVGIDEKSLNRAKDRLAKVIKPFEEAMKKVELDGLTGSNKSQVKTELTSLFKLTEKQAKALQDMVNGIIPSDEKQLNNLKQNVQDLTIFMTDAMKRMSDLGEATNWMKNGISFIDAFSHMQNVLKETEQIVGDLPSTIAALTQEFKIFKEALLDINPNAFGKRFGAEIRATTNDIKKAQDLIKSLEKQEHKGLQRALKIKKDEELFDYNDYSADELKEAHEEIQESIRSHLETIAEIEAKYAGKKKSPYAIEAYREAVYELVVELQNFENLKNAKLFESVFSKSGSAVASNADSITAEITTAAKDAVRQIQNALKDIDGIELSVTLPDAKSAEFASQISKFVDKATDEFKTKPIELSFDITNPFKKDAFEGKLSEDGELQYKKLSEAQQKISDRIAAEFKNEAEKSEFTVTEDNLVGLNRVNTNRIARNILDAFTSLNKSMREGQALLTGTTAKWRQQLEKDLTIKPKFAIDEAKESLNKEMENLQDEFEVDEENWLAIHADVDGLIEEIQGELNKKTFDVNIKANNIDGGNIVLSADQISFGPPPNGGNGQNPSTPPNVTQQTPPQQSKKTEPIKTEAPKQTKAVNENSSVIKEGTKVQVVLTNALNELKNAMKVNESRKEMSEQLIKDTQITVQENAAEIEARTKSVEKAEEEIRRHGEKRRLSEEDKELKELDRQIKSNNLNSLSHKFYKIFKSGDLDQLKKEFSPYMDMLANAKEELQLALNNIDNFEFSDDQKDKLSDQYKYYIGLIDEMFNSEDALSKLTSKSKKSKRLVFYDLLDAIYKHEIDNIDSQIAKLQKDIDKETNAIMNLSGSSGRTLQSIRDLEHVDEIENRERSIKKRDNEQNVLASRINKINKILEGDKDPIHLVLDEINSFWRSYAKNAEDARAYVEQKNAEIEALDASIKDKNLDKNSKEYKEYQKKRAAIIEDKTYQEYKKKYDKWEPRRAAMAAAGLDIRNIDKDNVLDYLRDLLKNNPALAARLTNNDADLKIRSIQDLAYFIPKVQETMGVKSRTENEDMSDEELRTNFKEALKVAAYIEKAKGVLNKFDGDLDPDTIQDFIDYFEHIPGMADAVEKARQYLDSVKDLPEEMLDEIEPKTFLEQFKDSWSGMDKDSRNEFLSTLNLTHPFDNANLTSVDNVDNWDKLFDNVLAGYRESYSKLQDLREETNNPQLQQILNILERSTLLDQTRDAANKYGEHGIVSALFGIQNSKLVGNNTVPKNPIHMTALSKKGRTKVYTIGKKSSNKGTDNTFSWGPEQLKNAFKFANVTQEIQEITEALFNSALIGQEQLQNEIKGLQSELSILNGLGKITTQDKAERKKQLDKFSYNAFDGTDRDVEFLWHRKKDINAEIESINDVLSANLEMQTFPDKLFKDIEGLRYQKRLEREIRELKNGDYSSIRPGSFKGLNQKEIGERVRNIITAREQELAVVKTENKAILEGLLLDKIKQLETYEDRVIKKTQEVITAKQQELATKQEELTQIKPIADAVRKQVDDLLNKLFASGKLKLSQGATADEATWAGQYKYQDSELAKYEKRKETNARESKRLKAQIAKLESGDYDDETKALLAENAAKEEENAKAQQENLKKQIANLEAKIVAIDKDVQDGKKTEDDGNKQKEATIADLEKAKNDLIALEQKMQNGELKSEIEQAQRAHVQQLIANLKSALSTLEQDAIATEDVIQSLLALEDDMQLSKEKAIHERSQGKGKNRQSKNLLGLIKRGNAYGSAKRKYKRAVYSEAWEEHKNEEVAKYGRTSSKDSVAKVDNLLRRIQFAKTYGLMNTTELEQLAAEYESLDKKYHETEDLKSLGKATADDVKTALKQLKDAREKLVNKFFNTEGWFKATRLEAQFSEIDGDSKKLEEQKREESKPAIDRVNAQKNEIDANEQKYRGIVEQYTDLLYEEYVEKPKREIYESLKQEVKDVRSAIGDNKSKKNAIRQRAEVSPETIPELQKEYLKIVNEQESDPEILKLIEKRKKLFEENKVVGADGKNTQEFKDVENAIAALRKKYSDKFNEFRDQWIREEMAKIDAAAIPDSAYSKHSIDIKTAEDDRDEAIARLKDKVKTVNVEEELEAFGKYQDLLDRYSELKKNGKDGTDTGKNIYTKLQTAWINEQTKIINDNFDNYVNEIIDTIFKQKGTKHDYKTTLGARKKEVIDRLMNDSTEFANIVEAIKNEKGIDAISAKGKNQTLDYFKLSKELMTRGIPEGLVDMKDLAVIADNGVGRSGDIGRHLKSLKDTLFKKIKGIITNAISQINTADIPSDAEVESEVKAIKDAAELTKKAALQEAKNKTDRELLASEYTQAKDNHEEEAKKYDERYEVDKKKKDRIMKEHPEVTQDVLDAARKGTLLYQEVAEEERRTTDAIEESNSEVESRKSISTSSGSSATNSYSGGQGSGGYYYGGYGGLIDTSGLAREGTLRGIYELLNGGAPKGGWDNSIGESDNTRGDGGNSDKLAANTVFGRYQSFAEAVSTLMKSAKETPHEMLSLLSKKNIVTQATSGERGFIAMDDVYGALKGEKNSLKAMLHNHPNGIGMMSKDDVQNFLKLAYDENIPEKQRVKIYGAYSDTELSSLNFNGISKKVAETIINTTFDELQTEAKKLGLTYNNKDQKYYRGSTALDPSNADDLDAMNLLEKYFYARLHQNFESFGFDQAFQYVSVDGIDDWVKTVTESAESILARAGQFVRDSAESAPINASDDAVGMATSQVANAIVENGTQVAVDAAKNITPEIPTQQAGQTAIANDLSAVYDKLFENISFDGVPKDLLNKIKADVIKQTKNRVGNEGHFKNRLKLTDDDRLEAVSAELYKIPEQRKKIIDDLMDTLEIYFILANQVYPYSAHEDDIRKYIDSILPDAAQNVAESVVDAGVQAATDAVEDAKQKNKGKRGKSKKTTDEKPVDNAPEVQTPTAPEQASEENKVTAEKEEQNVLAREAAQLEAELTSQAQERAAAEQKISDEKEEQNVSSDNIQYADQTSNINNNPPDNGDYSNGGLLGLLGKLAREDTLSSILAAINSGIKTYKDDENSKKTDSSNDKDEDSEALTKQEAETRLRAYLNERYHGAGYVAGAVKDTPNGYAINASRQKDNTEAIKEAEMAIANCEVGTNEWFEATKRLTMLQAEQEEIVVRINAETGKITASTSFKNIAVGAKAAIKELQNIDDIMERLHSVSLLSFNEEGNPTSTNTAVNNLLKSISSLNAFTSGKTQDELFDPSNQAILSNLAIAVQTYRKEVVSLLNVMDKNDVGKFFEKFNGDISSSSITDIKHTMAEMLSQSGKTITEFGDLEKVMHDNDVVAYKLAYTIKLGKREVQDMTAVLNPLTGAIKIQEGAVREVSTGWDKFISGFKGKLVSITQYLMSMASIHDVIRYMRQGVEYVREIDSALTELKKVTDETDASYSKFLKDMAKTGSVIGATVTDLTSSAADWAKLGYTIEQAGELAKNTSILMNVSEFDDVSKATETLISSLQAFKKEGTDVGTFSMEIIDKYNEVGNNYAISTSDLADSLTRSSAALVAANNSLEQSIAMTAAANTVIQDPESVGNALKTVSMRIRGVKTELEEAGEETDGMVTNTAKLQEKVMALTNIDGKGGIDILTDAGSFKSTYDILLEISKVWKEMDDTSQAALLELIAGKTRGSVVAALFQNGDVMENAYDSAMNASGSAMEELNNHLESIQGHIDVLNNSLQTMWMNFMNTDVVKWVVHLLTAITQLADTIGLIPTAAGAFAAFKYVVNDLKKVFDATTASTEKQAIATNIAAQADAKETATSITNATANIKQAEASNQVQKEKTEESAVLNKTALEDIKESGTSITGIMSGIGSGLSKAGSAFGKVGTVIATLAKSLGKAALVMIAVDAVSKVISSIYQAIDDAHQTTEELLDEWEELETEISNINDELEETQKRIKELENQNVLSFTDKKELELLRQQNDELERRLRITQSKGNTAAEAARMSVKADYEKNFISDTVVTDSAKKELNQVQGVLLALDKFKATPDINVFDSLEQWQKNALYSFAPELYNYISTSTYNALDTTTQQAIYNMQIQYDKRMSELIDATTESSVVSGEIYIDQAIQKIKEYKSELYDANGQLKDGLEDQYVVDINTNISDLETGLLEAANELYTYLDNYNGDANDPFVKHLEEQIEKIDMAVNPVEFYSKKFDEIFGAYSDEKRTLYELAQAGQLTAQTLNGIQYDPLMHEMRELGVTAQDVVDHITSLSESDLSKVTDPIFNISDYAAGIDIIQENISEYQSALASLEEGTFTYSDFIDLTQKFPDLAKGVDTSSKKFTGLAKNLKKAIKTSPEDLIDDLKSLRKQLQSTGKSTADIDQLIDSLENLPVETITNLSNEYHTLTDEINAAKKAQSEMQEAMGKNPNEGYETRADAMEYMKDKMSRGEIGSESELWDVAEKYGFTYDSAKTINENADALAKFIAIRETWFAKNDDGDYTFEGTENFVEAVESAVQNSEELKQLMTWNYDENTGALDFDFDNKNWDAIIDALSKTKELAGLTSDEFADMMLQIGQYFGINWGDIDDEIDAFIESKQKEYAGLYNQNTNGNFNYIKAAHISPDEMRKYYPDFNGDLATTYDAGAVISDKDGTNYSIVVSCITPDGTEILNQEDLDKYIYDYLAGSGDILEADKIANGGKGILINIEEGVWSGRQFEEFNAGIEKIKEREAEFYKLLTTGQADSPLTISTQEISEYFQVTGYELDSLIDKLKDKYGKFLTIVDNPLSINIDGDIETDIIIPLQKAGLEIETVIDAFGNKQFTFDVVDFESLLRNKGYTTENITAIINRLFGEGSEQSALVQAREYILNLSSITGHTVQQLKDLGLESATLSASSQGAKIYLDSSEVDEALKKYQFTDTEIEAIKAKWAASGIDIRTKEDTTGIDNTETALNELPEQVETKITANDKEFQDVMSSALNTLDDFVRARTATITVNVKTGEIVGSHSDAVSQLINQSRPHDSYMAYASGSSGVEDTEDALVGELGPEMIVDPQTNSWHMVGENGAEFTQVKRGQIVFNHKQTEQLLKNGHTASRGKLNGGMAFASGTAYLDGDGQYAYYDFSSSGGYQKYDVNDSLLDSFGDLSGAISDAADSLSDAADEFREVFDWIEVRLEEINEDISLKGAQLENAIGADDKNAIIDDMIGLNEILYDNLRAGAEKYYAYSQKLLAEIPAEYREAAQNGAIAIEEFVGEVDEKTLESITNFREWVQKGDDATQQAEEVLTEVRSLAKQQFDNVEQDYENELSIHDNKIDQFEANNSLLETDKGFASENIYNAIIGENEQKLDLLESERDALKVELEGIEVGTQDWYDAINTLMGIDTEIINIKTDIEDAQDSINELHWEKFDLLMSQFESVSNEADNLLDILGDKDAVDEFGNWTDEGMTSLGLLAQKMEVAEKQAAEYEEQITYLNANWEKLGYTEAEYLEQLDELKDGQYDAIKSYNDSKDAIVDLNKERVDAIKDGIEKEIEAYNELIEARKKDLKSQKDSHDFQKNIQDQTKNIADIERKIAALSGDTSGSAMAQRAKLEEELYKAKAELEETYYDRSIENQENSLDESQEAFEKEKEKEIEGWEKYLENIEVVVAYSLDVVRDNTSAVLTTLQEMQTHYGLMVTDALISPWNAGQSAIQIYGERLNVSLTQLAGLFGLTVDQFAAKLGVTTDQLVSGLNITVGQVAETLGLTNEEMAAKLGLTMTEYSTMADGTIQQLAANMGITLPELADKLGTTTAGLVEDLDITMAQFASAMGLSVEDLSEKFGLSTRDLAGMLGQTYQELTSPFGTSMSATVDELENLKEKYQSILDEIERESNVTVDNVNKAIDDIKKEEVKKEEPKKEEPQKEPSKQQTPARTDKDYYGVALAIWNGNYGWGTGTTRVNNLKAKGFDPNKMQDIVNQLGKDGYVHSGAWIGKYHGIKDLTPYNINKFAKGTTGVSKGQWAIIDELGEELTARVQNGKLTYLTKGSGVIPADMTSNLMKWGELDPQDMLDRNRPSVGVSPSVVNTEINIDCSVGTMVNIEHCDQNTLPDVEKIVNKAFDKHMQALNNAIRSKVR